MKHARSSAALLAASLVLLLVQATPVPVSGAPAPPSVPEHPEPPPSGPRTSHPTDNLPSAQPAQPTGRTGVGPAGGIGPFLTRPYLNQHSVTSVFDHCHPDYTHDGRVCEFDGTVAYATNGVDPGFPTGYAITPGRSDYLYYDGHNGWDLALWYEPVLSAAPGTVVIAGADPYNPGFGKTITVDHGNGFTTRYAHLSQVLVTPGQTVKRGQQIGVSGNTGNSTGPHLHFGLYITNPWTPIDPWGWTGFGPDPWPYDSGNYWLTGNPQNPVPSAPAAVSAVAGIGRAWVSWTPPDFDGGSPVSSYTVVSSPGQLTSTVGGGATSTVVNGLVAGTTYTFTVTATGAGGAGPPSTPSPAVVPMPPFDGSWGDLGGSLTSAPATASWAAGRQDVFVRGTDNALWHRWWDGHGWSAWEFQGGVLTSDPAVAARAPGRLDVFARGTDSALWHKSWDSSGWSGWFREDGALASAPAVAAPASDRLEVFIRGTDGGLWQKSWDGHAWGAWESHGGLLSSSPAAVSWGADRVDVFVRGTDGALWHGWRDGAHWYSWEWGGGTLSGPPAVASPGPNRLEVFMRGNDSGLYRRRWLGSGWTDWVGFGGQWSSSPAASSQRGPLTVDVFETGADRALKHATFD
jgi:murein DD-endopeptidase MepM/ murein hydrolase activator NlpD